MLLDKRHLYCFSMAEFDLHFLFVGHTSDLDYQMSVSNIYDWFFLRYLPLLSVRKGFVFFLDFAS